MNRRLPAQALCRRASWQFQPPLLTLACMLLTGLPMQQVQSAAADEWTVLEQQAADHYRSRNHEAALLAAREALALAERDQGNDVGTARVASSLNLLALVHQAQGDYAAAQPLLERAIVVAVQALPADHPNIVALRDNLEAVEQARREQEVAQVLQQAQQWNEQALLHHEQAEYAAAESLYAQVLPLVEDHFGAHSVETARVKSSLADTHAARKQYQQAQSLYQQMLAILELHPEERIAQAGALNALGVVHYVQRHHGQAQPLFQRSLELLEAQWGGEHESLLPMLDNLATLYRATNRKAEAEPLLRRAAAIRKAKEAQARAAAQAAE